MVNWVLFSYAKILEYDLQNVFDVDAPGNPAERICRELGDKNGLSTSLGNQAVILDVRGDLNGAMALLKQQEQLCEELGDKNGLSISFGNQALILKTRGDLDKAMALHKQEEQICRELGDKNGLQRSFCNQAVILQDRGDLDGAMTLVKQQEQLCREVGYKEGLSVSFAILLPGIIQLSRVVAGQRLSSSTSGCCWPGGTELAHRKPVPAKPTFASPPNRYDLV